MSDERHKLRARIGWLPVVLFVVYPLSTGPVDIIYCRCERYPWFQATVRAVNYPLGFPCEKSPMFNDLLGSYLGLWHRIVGDPGG
jgi:hypothetical protein